MNLGLVFATFGLVIPAELPDKTFISAVVLSSRYRPLPVWLGAASGLVLQAAIAVVAGRLLGLAPHRVTAAVVAALFLAGAAYLLFVPGEKVATEAEEIAETDERAIEGGNAPAVAPVHLESGLRIGLTTFGIVALAEFGDLTQVLIANLSARSRDPLSVFVGAAAAFLLVSALGVTAGQAITRFVPLSLVRRLSGLALLGLGIASAVSAAT